MKVVETSEIDLDLAVRSEHILLGAVLKTN
jgi:hypothetical protein